jgi:methionyl-tRNA formyltransferase
MSRRVVLAGNNLAAVYALDLLLEVVEPTDVLAVAPEPKRVADWQDSLESAAQAAGVPCIAPADVNDPEILERIGDHGADLLLSVYYTQIFKPDLLELVNGPILNVHPSLLPRHRGTAPVIWAIVEGDTNTGLTVHHIDAGIDTGNIVLQHRIPIHPDDTGYQLHLKLAKLARAAVADLIRDWAEGRPIPVGQEQTGDESSHSNRDPRVNHLNWSLDRARIRNIVRALAPPLPGAFSLLDGQVLAIAKVDPVDYSDSPAKPAGMIELPRTGAPLVWAADGPLRMAAFVDDGVTRPGEDLQAFRNVAQGQILE